MSSKLPPIEILRGHVEQVIRLATGVIERAAIDRAAPLAALQAALIGLLGWAITQASCMAGGLQSPLPQGIAPNVRSMLETLITALYLTDSKATDAERERRLERYFRGVRRDQVKLRKALDPFPVLKETFLVDAELERRERLEYEAIEAGLPAKDRMGGRHWAGLPHGLLSVADEVGMGSDYAVQYRVNSGSTHAGRPWDIAQFEEAKSTVLPSLTKNRDLAVPLGFDAFRYLAWLLQIVGESGAVALKGEERAELDQYRRFMQPLVDLLAKGIVGAGPPLR